MLGGEGDSPYSERRDFHNKQISCVSVRVQLGYVPDISEFRRPLSPTSIRQKTLKKTTLYLRLSWRRERDSNPRYAFNVHTISNRALSASQTSLQSRRI